MINRKSQNELMDAILQAQTACITEQELTDIKKMVRVKLAQLCMKLIHLFFRWIKSQFTIQSFCR